MPPLRRQSRIGDYRPVVSIQRRGLVRDGLWRKKVQWRRRRQSRQARHGNKRSWEQKKKLSEQGRGFQRRERATRKKTREEKLTDVKEETALAMKSFQVDA